MSVTIRVGEGQGRPGKSNPKRNKKRSQNRKKALTATDIIRRQAFITVSKESMEINKDTGDLKFFYQSCVSWPEYLTDEFYFEGHLTILSAISKALEFVKERAKIYKLDTYEVVFKAPSGWTTTKRFTKDGRLLEET